MDLNMTTVTIPLSTYPNQIVSAVINNDRWTISLFTRLGQLFATVETEDNGVLVSNRVCLDSVPITPNLVFIDGNGTKNPEYTGLNSRFFLVWSDET